MVKIIRERHPEIPIVVQSPIFSPDREINENVVGLNLVKMREELADAVERLRALGDDRLFYLDGLKIFGPEHIDHLPDRLHPDAEGYRIMADNFEKYVMEEMGIAKMLAEKTSGRA
jgi:lysophospholipase L1-like esterase